RHYTRFLAFPAVKRPGVEKQHSILQWLTADVPTPSGREKFFCGRYCGSWARSSVQETSASSRYSPSTSAAGLSVIENRIASSSVVFSCECHCQDGTTKISPFSQLNSLAETLVIPRPRKL